MQPLVAVLLIGLLAGLRGVDFAWDMQHYHLVTGWSALHGHLASPDWVPAGFNSFLNPILDTAHAFFYLRGPWVAHVVFTGLTIVACLVARALLTDLLPSRFRSGWRSWMVLGAAVVSVLGSDALGQIGGAAGDLTLALPVLAGAWLVHRGLTGRAPSPRREVVWGCALFGGAMALKMTIIPIAVGFVIAAAIATKLMPQAERADRPRVGARHAIGGLVGGWSVLGLPWAMYLTAQFRNPVFPFFNTVFRSPWGVDANWEAPFRTDLLHIVVLPFRIAFVSGTHDVASYRLTEPRFLIGVIGGLVGVGELVRRRWRAGTWRTEGAPAVVFLCGGWLLSYMLWGRMLAYTRYAIPLLALAVPCAVCAARAVGGNLRVWRRHRGELLVGATAILLAVSGLVVLTSGVPEWGPRSTAPSRGWEFPDGPQSDLVTPLLSDWRGQDVYISTFPWPLGHMSIELEPKRVWNLRESIGEPTSFSDHMAEVIDRSGALVVFDPQFKDLAIITAELEALLDEPVDVVACGVFDNGWTRAQVCEWAAQRFR